jgi:hypothetical protein
MQERAGAVSFDDLWAYLQACCDPGHGIPQTRSAFCPSTCPCVDGRAVPHANHERASADAAAARVADE